MGLGFGTEIYCGQFYCFIGRLCSYVAIPHTFFPGEPLTFTVEVTPAADYPLDLYFLMDLSSSMQDDLNTIRLVAGELGKEGPH